MTAELGLVAKVEAMDGGLAGANVPHSFGGALALAYYATPRATIDIDVNVFVGTDDYPRVADALRATGVDQIPDRAVVDRNGQVRARWGRTPVDLFFSYDPIHDAMRDAVRRVPFGETTIPILAPEHLLVAKAVFNRPKDWIDIEQMTIAVDDLDAAEIRRWLAHLAGEDDPRFLRVDALLRELR